MIEAYRTIAIDIDLGGRIVTATVPFTMELLLAVEETILAGQGLVFFRTRRGEKSILKLFEDFCKPHLPPEVDLMKVQPAFAALFFSRVRGELMHSMHACVASMSGTETSPASTDAKTTAPVPA